ncbi:hypothetical protein [Raoultibacter phocaeensis]|uniref:hypothetical protein n=1 Tax=Raoultibacter phocaeensis TaxID=2479841 RepID=UPI0021024149|nr:hypothetical protein [Raoultibacter phocaeensis]
MTVRNDIDVYRNHPVRASWKIPAFCCNDWGALKLLELCSTLGFDRPFDIVYGAPYCAWSGGRPSAVKARLNEEQLDTYFSAYAHFGVRCALTLSRLSVDEGYYRDTYCNLLLDFVEEYDGEVILFDDVLANHIKQTRPSIKTVASLNKAMSTMHEDCEQETAYYRSLLELYDEIVVRSEYALNDECLENLYDVREKVEIIVNQFCVPNCQNVYNHIKKLEEWNDGGCRGSGQPCYHLETASNIENRLGNNLFISNSRISYLCSRGFTRMKIAGRNSPLPLFLDALAEYVFEPTGAIAHIKRALIRDFKNEAAAKQGAVTPFDIPESILHSLSAG